MYSYDFIQWLTFFYLYSFLGWCFESAVVSFSQRQWVNRGFMRGPLLPLYGFGAITVLFSTLPVQQNPVLTFLLGSIAATILEYFTGVCMEALFQVRYWDYSGQRFQFQGHICLRSSIAWGVLSLFMVKIHHPIAQAVALLPQQPLTAVILGITILASMDLSASLRTALDLKQLLVHSQKLQEELGNLQSRATQLEQRLQQEKQLLAEKRQLLLQTVQSLTPQQMEQRLQKEREAFFQRYHQFIQELESVKARQQLISHRIGEKLTRDKVRMLLRNPSASSRKYKEAWERLKNHRKLDNT